MNRQLIKDSLGWGLALWFIGYVLGMVLFFVMPVSLMGWVITPIGVIITLWVLHKKIKLKQFGYYLALGIVWTVIAIGLDYFFIVKLLNPADGYYKPDVYLYYSLTLVLPLAAGWWRISKGK